MESRDNREIFEDRRPVAARIYAWERLSPGDSFDGPAVVEAIDTTVFVPTGFTSAIDAWGNIVSERG